MNLDDWFGPSEVLKVESTFPKEVMGSFCEDCPGCEWNGFKETFVVVEASVWCRSCGHMVCPVAPARRHWQVTT